MFEVNNQETVALLLTLNMFPATLFFSVLLFDFEQVKISTLLICNAEITHTAAIINRCTKILVK